MLRAILRIHQGLKTLILCTDGQDLVEYALLGSWSLWPPSPPPGGLLPQLPAFSIEFPPRLHSCRPMAEKGWNTPASRRKRGKAPQAVFSARVKDRQFRTSSPNLWRLDRRYKHKPARKGATPETRSRSGKHPDRKPATEKSMKSTFASIYAKLWAFAVHEEGQDLIEYGLLATLIACAAIASIKSLGPTIANMFTNISTSVS